MREQKNRYEIFISCKAKEKRKRLLHTKKNDDNTDEIPFAMVF